MDMEQISLQGMAEKGLQELAWMPFQKLWVHLGYTEKFDLSSAKNRQKKTICQAFVVTSTQNHRIIPI